MRICLVAERFHPFLGGSETRWFELGRRLAKNHTVHVYTIRGDITAGRRTTEMATLAEEEELDGMIVHRFSAPTGAGPRIGTRSIYDCLRYAAKAAACIKTERFDVCDVSSYPLVHLPVIKQTAANGVLTWHEVWGPLWRTKGGMNIFGKEVELFVSKSWGRHIAVSKFTAERLHTFCRINQDRISIVPNGAGEEFFHRGKKENGKLICVGRLTPDKHPHDLLLDAFAEAKAETESLNLHILGSGPLLELVKRRARNLKDVFVHGEVNKKELVLHMRSASILCLLSEFEGTGIVALEAMASGTPVLVADFPMNAAAHEIVKSGFNGLVVEPTVNEIVEGIRKIHERWKILSSNAAQFARTHTWDKAVAELERIYEASIEA